MLCLKSYQGVKYYYRDSSPLPWCGGNGLLELKATLEREAGIPLEDRIRETLRLLLDWGQAATLSELEECLIEGTAGLSSLREALGRMDDVRIEGGVVGIVGHEDTIARTQRRRTAHESYAPQYLGIAMEFASDLVSWCPVVTCVAITGSLASGGFDEGDDLDFNLVVEDGTKYLAYLAATLLGIRYAWRYRKRKVRECHRTPLLPKIACVNVVWTDEQTRPFVRQDLALAFELLRSRPLLGRGYFSGLLGRNSWARTYFPQLLDRAWEVDEKVPPNAVGRFVIALSRWPRVLGTVEMASRAAAWIIYRFVQWTRRRIPEAVSRSRFLRRAKRPYEVFQD